MKNMCVFFGENANRMFLSLKQKNFRNLKFEEILKFSARGKKREKFCFER